MKSLKQLLAGSFAAAPLVYPGTENPYVRVKSVNALQGDPFPEPQGTILYYDADTDPYLEKAEFGHEFNYNVLGPQYQRAFDGSYTDVGANPAVDVFDGEKWLLSCGSITNLFSGDTSVARSVTLTAQAYTLQVFGAGSVSCSYGTATVGSPLTFTAIVGLVTFTPTGATLWMLTATSYPVPYTPPGTTMPASNATVTNGCWFALPDGSPVWKALDGEPDGVELVTNGGFDSDTSGWTSVSGGILNLVSGKLRITGAAGDSAFAAKQQITCIAGQKYKIIWEAGGTALPNLRVGTPEMPEAVLSINGSGYKTFTFIAPQETLRITLYGLVVDEYAEFDNISIQRIQPQPLTLATRVRMGVGSGDLESGTGVGIVSSLNSYANVQYAAKPTLGVPRIVYAYDGVNVTVIEANWPRNSIIRRVTQVNTAGTQFRVGCMIEGTHTAIQWGYWVAYDGSFNPSTLYRLMLGYNNPYPVWFNKIAVWNKQMDDAAILEALGQ